ncbi:MAG: aminotransferase class I/II-fold pyridoxal phosphate-dependent enzyme [Thermoanaerobaculaceae bacterium]|jgi:dTDP-4-amino-4,6-dideoxygalactose transaminase|nr:aminotransferase class I/II-fold pyridoxal phosphate-dependent enzyme [Thermoanaerobaculaceae bacterium]
MQGFSKRADFLPFSRPTIRQVEIDEVVATLQSGWITTGPRAERFEKEFAAYTGFPHVLALSSATAGLHIGLLALGLRPGDEVITTPITWAATVNMIEALGGVPVFVDVRRDDLQMDPRHLAAALTPRTVGIIPVHYAGAACNMDLISKVACAKGLWVFEDAAHGVGTRYKGRHVGCDDRLGVFSFHPIKNMTTGEGGALVTRDEDLARHLRALRFHGLEKQAWNRYAEGGTPQVEVILPGFKYNFMDLQAALGIHQLASVDEFNARRRELADLYDRLLAEVPEIEPLALPAYDHFHTRHLYVVKVLESAGIDRDTFIARLRARNVGTGIHFRAVHTQPYYAQKYPRWLGALPVSEWASERLCSLPLFPLMSEDDVQYVVAAIRDALREGK